MAPLALASPARLEAVRLSRVLEPSEASRVYKVLSRHHHDFSKQRWLASRLQASKAVCEAVGLPFNSENRSWASALFLPTDFAGENGKAWETIVPFIGKGVEIAGRFGPPRSGKPNSRIFSAVAGVEAARLLRFASFALTIKGGKLNYVVGKVKSEYFPEFAPGYKRRFERGNASSHFQAVLHDSGVTRWLAKRRRGTPDGFVDAVRRERRRLVLLASALLAPPVSLTRPFLLGEGRYDYLHFCAKEVEYLSGSRTRTHMPIAIGKITRLQPRR